LDDKVGALSRRIWQWYVNLIFLLTSFLTPGYEEQGRGEKEAQKLGRVLGNTRTAGAYLRIPGKMPPEPYRTLSLTSKVVKSNALRSCTRKKINEVVAF
jgi:hypothetical protein